MDAHIARTDAMERENAEQKLALDKQRDDFGVLLEINEYQAQENQGMRDLDVILASHTSLVSNDTGLSFMMGEHKASVCRLFAIQLAIRRSCKTDAEKEDRDNVVFPKIAKMLSLACMNIVAISNAAGQAAMHKRYAFVKAYVQHARELALANPEHVLPIGEFESLFKLNEKAKTEAEKIVKATPAEEPAVVAAQAGVKRGWQGNQQPGRPWPQQGGGGNQQGGLGPMQRAMP